MPLTPSRPLPQVTSPLARCIQTCLIALDEAGRRVVTPEMVGPFNGDPNPLAEQLGPLAKFEHLSTGESAASESNPNASNAPIRSALIRLSSAFKSGQGAS